MIETFVVQLLGEKFCGSKNIFFQFGLVFMNFYESNILQKKLVVHSKNTTAKVPPANIFFPLLYIIYYSIPMLPKHIALKKNSRRVTF